MIYVAQKPKDDHAAAARVPPRVPITAFAATGIPAAPNDKQNKQFDRFSFQSHYK